MSDPDLPDEWLATKGRLEALADAYEPGNYALADGVCHVYYDVPECCQTLRDDLRIAVSAMLAVRSTVPNAVETVERAVGERVYQRISELMDAEATAGTPVGVELACLAALVADVEEYGFGLTTLMETT